MENKPLLLPAGIQTFSDIRTGGYVYVDKTQYLVRLIENGKIFFLARPRRFGKSLTVTAFESLFSGRKDLFKGLAAEEYMNRPEFQPCPVIRLDMSDLTTSKGIEGLEESIAIQARRVADNLDVQLSDTAFCGELLSELIVKTSKKHDCKVVVLVDEYDKPYTDFMTDPDMANRVRSVLRDFYVRIKAQDQYIRFTFITGISKFAKFGVFSTMNTLVDISLNPEYAAICGYTEDEITHYFPYHLDTTAAYMQITAGDLLKKMRDYYNGFTFDSDAKTRLYNPFSTLQFFFEKYFFNYWIDSGQPAFIADYMRDRKLTVEQFRNMHVDPDFVRCPGDMDATPPHGFLNQAGYLTLRRDSGGQLMLDYPNTEVLNSMSKLLARNIFDSKGNEYSSYSRRVMRALKTNNCDLFIVAINALLASIPYDDYAKAAEESVEINDLRYPAQEWLYRSCILSFLRGCGIVVVAELHTHFGRPDLVIADSGNTWVIELKVAYEGQEPEKRVEDAIRQLIDKQYTKAYPDALGVGLAIDNAQRQITAKRLLSIGSPVN